MKIVILLFAFAFLFSVEHLSARDIPRNVTRLNSDVEYAYELINPVQAATSKPISDIPPSNNNKTFVYDPTSKTWTPIKSTDPDPKEGSLTWNQNNDKWLTQSFWP